MVETLSALVALFGWVILVLARFARSLIKLIVIAAVVLGALNTLFAHAPASWPQFEFSIEGFLEYLALAFMMATNGWLPLGIALMVLWIWGIRNNVEKFGSHATHVKIAIVALMNYLDLGVETEGMKELKEEGFKSIIQAWKVNIGLKLLTGTTKDDALTAKPVRLNSGASVNLISDIDNRIQETIKRMATSRGAPSP